MRISPYLADAPDYPSHQQLLRYFTGYAEEFGLLDQITFNTTVSKAEPIDGGRWRLTWKTKGKKEQQMQ